MNLLETLLKAIPDAKVVNASAYIPIDLSVSSKALAEFDNKDAGSFERFIDDYLSKHKAEVAFGGYNEHRNLYKRSEIFNDGENEPRNTHIGLDLWTKAGTPILAALDGNVHSFDYNTGTGNYGPTIILEHQINGQRFYTLYGHLSLESIEEIEIGDTVKKGQQIATLGDATVNDDYAPHLHFQVIGDIGDYFGDYPGVCSESDLDFYLENCPDPNVLLKLNTTL